MVQSEKKNEKEKKSINCRWKIKTKQLKLNYWINHVHVETSMENVEESSILMSLNSLIALLLRRNSYMLCAILLPSDGTF